MSSWIEVGHLNDIPVMGARVVARPEGDVAIFRASDDTVFALRDACPHRGGPLSQGIVHGHRVTCPLHNWVIEMNSGHAVAPDVGSTGCFATKVEAGVVYVALR